ncbi:O-antigen ligase family protein [Winogradskyella sp.]|uniref:O-antigen ligase family protein n=1 Tax=Winogradskyella sp. TaxID=1883156 RepID=UPI003511181D
MGNFLAKKNKLLEVLFYVLACYPLLRFNLSSNILVAVFVAVLFVSYKNSEISFSKRKIKLFIIATLYFIIATISILYSEDKSDGIKRITRLIPLLIVPGILIFSKPQINSQLRHRILNAFAITNSIYLAILFVVYTISSNHEGISNVSFLNALSNRNEFQALLDDYLGYDTLFIHKAYLSMGFVVLAIFGLQRATNSFRTNKTIAIVYTFVFFIFSFLVISLFSFPNVIALVLALVVFYFYHFKNKEQNKLSILIVSSIVLLGTFGVVLKSDDLDVKRGVNFVKSIVANKNVEFNDPRKEIYATVNSLYEKASIGDIVFGFGIGDVQSKLNDEYSLRLKNQKEKNILLFSEEFNDDYWHKNNIEIKANTYKSPLNNNKADAIKEISNGVVSHNISTQLDLDKPTTLTFSVYSKKNDGGRLVLRLGEVSQRASFNLSDGTYRRFSDKVNVQVVDSGDWYRCAITTVVSDNTLVIIGLSNSDNEYNYKGSGKELVIWGAQLEEGTNLTSYDKNDNALLQYVNKRELNSHNNYLYFFLCGGIFGVISFVATLFILLYIAVKNKSVFQITICIILAFNFLTENILLRHWGLMFVSFMLLLFFTKNQKPIGSKTKDIIR